MLSLNSYPVFYDYPSMPTTELTVATFNAKLLHPILLTAKHYRLPLADLLSQLNIDDQQLDTPGQRYPISTLATLLETLSDVSDNPAFAIRAAEATQPRMLGNTGFAMCTASTFLESFQTLCNYSALAFEGITLKLETQNQHALITLETDQKSDHLIAFFIGCLCNWSRWLSGSQIPVKSLKLSLSQNKFAKLEQYLASEIQFEKHANQIIFDQRYLNTPCVEANSDMHQLHCQYADTLLLQVPQSNTIISQTKVQIRQLINLNEYDPAPIRREDIAKRLNMSLRTFQRKLHSAQSNFQDVYDQVRRESCLALIAENSLNLGQISYRLGFANSSALQKAFKRWMSTTPSNYRHQLLSHKQKLSEEKENTKSILWFNQTDKLEQESQQRLSQLSDFSAILLSWLACFKHCDQHLVPLQDLETLTGNSIARLSIYLWPAQQNELLFIKDENSEVTTSLCQLQPDLIADLLHQQNPRLCSEQHFNIALMMIDKGVVDKALQHFNQCHAIYLSDNQCAQLFTVLTKLLTQSKESLSIENQALLLSIMISFSERVQNTTEQIIELKLALLQCQISNQDWRACHDIISELTQQPLSQTDQLLLSVYRAELMIAHYQFDQALALLLSQVSPLIPSMADSSANSTLINIALQIESIKLAHNALPTTSPQNSTIIAVALQKLILIALKARSPLIAANATCALLGLVNTPENQFLRGFAYSHFSWICSWFGGHSEAAFSSTQIAMKHLADVDSKVYLDCIYVLYSRVYHWLTPLNKEIEKLSLLLTQIEQPSIEHQILLQQMRLCSGASINSILKECQILNQYNDSDIEANGESQPATSTLTLLCQKLINNKKALGTAENIQSDDFYQLFLAFYTQDYAQWEGLKFSAIEIENATPSHFIAIEANFICLLMQIHDLEQTNPSPLTHRQIEGQLARFEIWAQQCPDNFAPPFALAKAIYASYTQPLQQASALFEQAISLLNQNGHLHHKIIAYRYYANLLKADKPHLSTLCYTHQQALYNQWIAKDISD